MVNGFTPVSRSDIERALSRNAETQSFPQPFQTPVEQQLLQQQQQIQAALGQRQAEQQTEQQQIQAGLEQQVVAPGATADPTAPTGEFGTDFANALAAAGAGIAPTSGRGLEDLTSGFLSSFSKARGAKRTREEKAAGVEALKEARTAGELEDFLLSGIGTDKQQAIALRRIESKEKREDARLDRGVKSAERGIKASKETFDKEKKLRDSFLKESGEFIKQRDAFARVTASAKDPSAAGDFALIFNYLKVLDPGSTVREGEFASAAAAAGLGDRIIGLFGRVDEGTRLAPDQRKDFEDRASKLFDEAQVFHDIRIDQFTGLADRNDLDVRNVTLDVGLTQGEEEAPTADITTMTDEELQSIAGQ